MTSPKAGDTQEASPAGDDLSGGPAAPALDYEDDPFELPQPAHRLAAGLYVVATPIGNLGDITTRAITTLRAADLIACEDTRHSGMLLKHLDIKARLISLNEHNEAQRTPQLLDHMRAGGSVALISDAGMPTISDPGQRFVAATVAAGFPIDSLPGPSAVLTALAASGLPTTPFYFGGFLPHKKGARGTELAAALAREATSIYFESPYRILDTLEIIATAAPEHRIVVARELTKKFAEFQRGPAARVHQHFQSKAPKGEFTLLLAPATPPKWLTW
ncbi:MAG: 16S rRNA (cytidine(1402)-2'-O)-methyltransferase [Verrucomicrobiaceae bacterium]|nr:16S rRNA (cytidine(1402)-2'-O)-methyltransferase [Verrucomicrobiaceae bacterium]